MGREIEVKIPLMQKEFMKIMAWILEREKNPGIVFKNREIVFKTDEYYSQYKSMKSRLKNEPRVIRIRTQTKTTDLLDLIEKESFEEICARFSEKRKQCLGKAESFFAIKTKRIQDGIEFNEESETPLENSDVLRQFFAQTKFHKWFQKEKIALGTKCIALAAENCAPLVLDGVGKKHDTDKNSVLDIVSAQSEFSASNIRPLEFHLELELVNGLPYIEIEYTKEDEPAENVRIALDNLIERLSLDKSKKDSRSWVQIIKNA